jgi:hypothetical protein
MMELLAVLSSLSSGRDGCGGLASLILRRTRMAIVESERSKTKDWRRLSGSRWFLWLSRRIPRHSCTIKLIKLSEFCTWMPNKAYGIKLVRLHGATLGLCLLVVAITHWQYSWVLVFIHLVAFQAYTSHGQQHCLYYRPEGKNYLRNPFLSSPWLSKFSRILRVFAALRPARRVAYLHGCLYLWVSRYLRVVGPGSRCLWQPCIIHISANHSELTCKTV